MKTRLILFVTIIFLMTGFSSCYINKFSKEVFFDLTFDVKENKDEVQVQYLLEAREYSSEFNEYKDNIEDIEIQSMSCYLSEFNGSQDQLMESGTLTVADENGNKETTLVEMNGENLEQLYLNEKELDLDYDGTRMVESLILQDPNKCLGTFTAKVSEQPTDFVITFHIRAIISGKVF